MLCDRVWRNAHLATMRADLPDLGEVPDGLVACRDGRIVYAGAAAQAPVLATHETIDCDGRWITPGLIDAHTHLVYAGDRANEFRLRLKGATYEEIARAGGGIVSTVQATRAASETDLVAASLPRLDALLAEGVTTVEIKSGYGLSTEHELKQLRAARKLGQRRAVRVATTFLGAHALPPEFKGDADAYIATVCGEMIPAVAQAGLADAVDAFCEGIGFSPDQVRRVFEAAKAHGLAVKLHAEQLSDLGGAGLAAAFGALSADHLEYVSDRDIEAMRRAGVVAMLLPGAFYFLRETTVPPVAALRQAGVPMALSTDCNPGTSPITSILLILNMGATLFGLTVEECLLGVTRHAAQALGLSAQIGTLEAGKACDLAIWDVGHPAELVYRLGLNPLHTRVWNGADAPIGASNRRV